jgi:hypothetical protein
MCTGKHILPNHGIMWEAIERPNKMGVAKCTTLAFEEECDDLVGVASGG